MVIPMQGVLLVAGWLCFMLSLGALGNAEYVIAALLLAGAWGLVVKAYNLSHPKR